LRARRQACGQAGRRKEQGLGEGEGQEEGQGEGEGQGERKLS